MGKRVLHDYKCETHGYFESREAKCPMKQCDAQVMQVFLQAPGLLNDKTKAADKHLKQMAIDFKMTDIKSTRVGEHQEGYFKKYAPPAEPEVREPRAGDAAIWGGGFQNLDMQSILSGRAVKSVKGEAVGLSPREAGIQNGPVIDPKATFRDHENLQIKK